MDDSTDPQSGNILFLILIAVVLLGALIFAVTLSTRQGGEDVNREVVSIAASRLAQHSVDLEQATLRVKLSRRMADGQISFENPAIGGYENPFCTTDECRVFSPVGGQASYITPDPSWLQLSNAVQDTYGEWIFTGDACIPGIGNGHETACETDADHSELIAIVPWVIRDVCVEVNQKLGIAPAGNAPPQLTGDAWNADPRFVGTFATGHAIIDAGGALYGRYEGCFEGAGRPPAGTYHYFRVLVAR